ncbi:MAG: YceI family protein [Pseudomonadota bacterium]
MLRSVKLALAAALIVVSAPTHAFATSWIVVKDQSRIGFSGTHAGTNFKGQFENWNAEIVFDPEALETAKATVTVDLTSAQTGNATYDKSLPNADWFDTKTTAAAVFTSETIKRVDGDSYVADGTLNLRGAKVPVSLAFDLKINGDTATMTGTSTLARLDFGIGKASDAGGAWVSLDIPVDVKVVAKRAE